MKEENSLAEQAISTTCDAIRDLLISKNKSYGNSAFDPVRIFSKSNTDEQFNVRIDDKLSRLMRGQDAGEDTEWDLIGYLILKRAQFAYKKLVREDRQS